MSNGRQRQHGLSEAGALAEFAQCLAGRGYLQLGEGSCEANVLAGAHAAQRPAQAVEGQLRAAGAGRVALQQRFDDQQGMEICDGTDLRRFFGGDVEPETGA